jgi:hypothetical protein
MQFTDLFNVINVELWICEDLKMECGNVNEEIGKLPAPCINSLTLQI